MIEMPSVHSPSEAAAQLQWLIAMGADEVMAAEPVNRFEEVAAAKPKLPARSQATAAAKVALSPTSDGDWPARAMAAQSLGELDALLATYDTHPLKRTASNACLWSGLEAAPLLILGDRPREEEDKSGLVFAAKHQALLQRMLAAIGIADDTVAMANLLPWRPPGNRPPTDAEVDAIVPFAKRAIQLIRPRIILAFGTLPALWLGNATGSMAALRGKWHEAEGVPMLTTFHPETLLKSPASKRLAWHDLLALKARIT